MKITCFAFYSEQIIKTTTTGEVDLEASKQRLRKLAAECESIDCGVLLDLRRATSKLTLIDMYELAQELGRMDPPCDQRIAILFSGDERDLAVDKEMSSSRKGLQLSHFVEFEDAMSWLNSDIL